MELAYADEEIDAAAEGLKTAELLAVPRGSPLLRIRQLILTQREGLACTSWASAVPAVTRW